MSVPNAIAEQDWGERLVQDQDRLERMIRVRMDPRLSARLDPMDVVQETFLEATRRQDEYRRQPELPFIVWLRFIALQKLAELHRRHLRVQARSVHREVWNCDAQATSGVLAAQLLGQLTTPSQLMVRDELEHKLVDSIESMEVIDRECIILRNFEHMTNAEASAVLGLNESAASSRYVRALQKLRAILDSIEGLSHSDWP